MLEKYDSMHRRHIRDGRGNGRVRFDDLGVIEAEATLKIIKEASGFLLGKARHNMNRIIDETGVESLDVDSMS